ncbi:MAG: VTT domain-containing protein [Clostridia bacterium]|nr:VTT domain-containing protein [Clostridia bacterium]
MNFIKKHKIKIVSITTIILMIVVLTIICIDLIPIMRDITAPDANSNSLVTVINAYGPKGVFLLISLEALQVMSAVIPGAPIQILAGLTYGILYGILICVTGNVVGNAIVFIFVRQLRLTFNFNEIGHPKKARKSKWDFSFIKNSKHLMLMVFLLFLIPGIPNGILPYLFANTKISMTRYLFCVLIAGTPAVLISILVGERISKGDAATAIIIVVIVLVLSVTVILARKRMMAYLKQKAGINKNATLEQKQK